MEWVTLLAGAGIALGSAFLGIVSEGAKGWVARRNTIADRRAEFQHATAVELQETLFEAGKISLGLVVEMTIYNRDREGWTAATLSDEMNLKEQQLLTRVNILKSRIDDPVVREKVGAHIDMTGQALKIQSMKEAEALIDEWIETQRSTDDVIGQLIRDTWPRGGD